MKPENYEKVISLMDQRERLVLKADYIKAYDNKPYVAIQADGMEDRKPMFGYWASSAKTASALEKCTAKYISELAFALAFEISEIDEKLSFL